MNPRRLHIWPRGSFMMIALPNQDHSWTVTLFMPANIFAQLDTPSALIKFFQTHYPDAVPLIGKERLVRDFFATRPSPLVSIKVSFIDYCLPFIFKMIDEFKSNFNRFSSVIRITLVAKPLSWATQRTQWYHSTVKE